MFDVIVIRILQSVDRLNIFDLLEAFFEGLEP